MNNARKVALTKYGVELNGTYEVLLCGSLFYFRLPRAVWKDRIEKLKRAGYNCVDVYFPGTIMSARMVRSILRASATCAVFSKS